VPDSVHRAAAGSLWARFRAACEVYPLTCARRGADISPSAPPPSVEAIVIDFGRRPRRHPLSPARGPPSTTSPSTAIPVSNSTRRRFD
jgi:hypothetical protein